VAVERLVRFYVDESAAGLGLALAAARKDRIHCGHPRIPECPRQALDTEWISAVAARGLVVIAPTESFGASRSRCALWDHGLRVFCIGGKRDLSTWEWLARVVRHWSRMEELIDRRGAGPWIYMLNKITIDEYVPKWAAGDQ
jgi:PIN like domain